jgi:hypothetical protein
VNNFETRRNIEEYMCSAFLVEARKELGNSSYNGGALMYMRFNTTQERRTTSMYDAFRKMNDLRACQY